MCKLFEEIHAHDNNKFIHEIRNSIQCIMGQLYVLKNKNKNEDSEVNFINIYNQLQRLESVCLKLEDNKREQKK